MSYSLGAVPQRANGIRVGSRASGDPILARASLEAAAILLRSTKWPKDERDAYIESQLRRFNAGTKKTFRGERLRLMRKGKSENQATFDAIRLIIANHYTQLGVEAIQGVLARIYSAESLAGRDEELVGCAVAGGTTAVVGSILGAYTGGVGSQAMAVGGSLVGAALDCGKEQREAQLRMAELEAQRAQAMADAAAAREAEGGFFSMSPQTKNALKVGGIALGGVALLFLVGYAIVKV